MHLGEKSRENWQENKKNDFVLDKKWEIV